VNVLDLGVGTGVLAKAVYNAGNKVTGIDFSSEMLVFARAKMPDALFIEWNFVNGMPPELSGKKYDFIVSTYALHHLTDALKINLLQDLKPCLNDNGIILIGDIIFATEDDRRACHEKNYLIWDDDEYPAAYSLSEEELKKDWNVQVSVVSHCSGILELRRY